jgi:TolA-binding protein
LLQEGPLLYGAMADDPEPLAPLRGLVERLREEVEEMQERLEDLSEELEAKRRRLKLAEATLELQLRPETVSSGEDGEEQGEGAGVERSSGASAEGGQSGRDSKEQDRPRAQASISVVCVLQVSLWCSWRGDLDR